MWHGSSRGAQKSSTHGAHITMIACSGTSPYASHYAIVPSYTQSSISIFYAGPDVVPDMGNVSATLMPVLMLILLMIRASRSDAIFASFWSSSAPRACFRRAVLSNRNHSPKTVSVRGVDKTKYIHKLRDTCPFKSGGGGSAQVQALSCGACRICASQGTDRHVPLLKSKNGMLKMDDMKAPGKKNEPSNVNVFIDALSRPLLSAKRCC